MSTIKKNWPNVRIRKQDKAVNLCELGCGMGFSQKIIEIYRKRNNIDIIIIDPKREYVHANPLCGCLKSLDSKGINS